MEFSKKNITEKNINFSAWYNDVILRAELADYAPVKGCMVVRPYGYSIWENIQKILDGMIKEAGVSNAYFPLFIPQSFLNKEKEHVRGFSPELAVVTIGGGEKLAEPLVVRPTSETVIYDMYSKWIHSWRDLPLLINQWCNIVRWEKRTYLFLRTSEFLWQEGHTVHSSHEESWKEVIRALMMYKKFVEENLAIALVVGIKSKTEKFAGAVNTTTFELLMPDGKALQGGTSHDLGQNFSKVFNISFQDKEGKREYGWQTSWGTSTRLIGGLIMVHGDNSGLILPPKIAPLQVVIIPIDPKNSDLLKYCTKIKDELLNLGIRVVVDGREEETVGYKFNKWELKGVPIRLEVGEKEMVVDEITIVRRDENSKLKVKSSKLQLKIKNLLDDIQKNLFARSKKFLEENTREATSYNEFKKIMEKNRGFIKAFWCENDECEKKIKEETKASSRCLSLDAKPAFASFGYGGAREENGKCIYCGKKAVHKWVFAQSY